MIRKLFSTGNFDFQKEVILDISGCNGLKTLVICALSPESTEGESWFRWASVMRLILIKCNWELQVSPINVICTESLRQTELPSELRWESYHGEWMLRPVSARTQLEQGYKLSKRHGKIFQFLPVATTPNNRLGYSLRRSASSQPEGTKCSSNSYRMVWFERGFLTATHAVLCCIYNWMSYTILLWKFKHMALV